jgi:hypothetical protein
VDDPLANVPPSILKALPIVAKELMSFIVGVSISTFCFLKKHAHARCNDEYTNTIAICIYSVWHMSTTIVYSHSKIWMPAMTTRPTIARKHTARCCTTTKYTRIKRLNVRYVVHYTLEKQKTRALVMMDEH